MALKCYFKNCKINNDTDILTFCRLCDLTFHIKCVGLTARVHDTIVANKGLRWFCESCRLKEVDLTRLLNSTRRRFDEISRDLASVQEKFLNFKSEFSSFECMDDSAKANSNLLLPEPPIQPVVDLPKPSREVQRKKKTTSQVDTAPSLINLLSPVPDHPANLFSELVVPDVNVTAGASLSTSIPLHVQAVSNGGSSAVTRNTSGAIPKNRLATSSEISAAKKLVVVEPRKTVFISRLAPDTSIEDVRAHINAQLGFDDTSISIVKYRLKPRKSYSSFNVNLPEHLIHRVLNPTFWPKNTVVHEFIFRPRGNRASKNSKN